MQISAAKQLSLPQLLARLHHQPTRANAAEFWYLSPLRRETEPSFCVKAGREVAWVFSDYGANIKGNILDFAMHYWQCDVKAALLWLSRIFSEYALDDTSTIKPSYLSTASSASSASAAPIQIYQVKEIQHPALISYLEQRAIAVDLARCYLKEVHYYNAGRPMFALGWQTRNGGWCLRARNFKSVLRPAGITEIGSNNQCLAIFEGMFDFLAALSYYQATTPRGQVIILNSTVNLHLAIDKIKRENYQSIRLYLDNDMAGRQATDQLLKLENAQDCSAIFHSAKDFADWYLARVQRTNLFSFSSKSL